MRALTFFSVCLVPVVSGCGPTIPQEVEDLQEFSLAYIHYIEEHNVAPAEWDDLVRADGIAPATVERLRNAETVVNWGITFRDGEMDYVLAYRKNAVDSGGQVLFLDGAVYRLDADELKDRLDSQRARQAKGNRR
jgi:hypothetical protein